MNQMISGSLALLYFSHGGKQGSGPDEGRSPVEWGEIPYVCPSICPPKGQPARPLGQLAKPQGQPCQASGATSWALEPARLWIQLTRPQVQAARWMDR